MKEPESRAQSRAIKFKDEQHNSDFDDAYSSASIAPPEAYRHRRQLSTVTRVFPSSEQMKGIYQKLSK
jgi:hypothetical protein